MNIATRYGNYCAAITIVFTLIVHYAGVNSLWTKASSSFFSSLVEVFFIGAAIYRHRELELNGYIDYRSAVKVGLNTLIVNAILFSFFQYLYYQFIDVYFIQNFVPEYEKWLALMGKAPEEVKKISALLTNGFSPISAAWASFSQMLFVETFIVLLVARIFRRQVQAE